MHQRCRRRRRGRCHRASDYQRRLAAAVHIDSVPLKIVTDSRAVA